jgi:hypothetical protein
MVGNRKESEEEAPPSGALNWLYQTQKATKSPRRLFLNKKLLMLNKNFTLPAPARLISDKARIG